MKSVSYYILSHNAFSAFVKNILAIIAKWDISTFGIQVLLDSVTVENDKYTKARQRNMVDPVTALLIEADDARKAAIVALNSFINSCLHDPDEEVKEAATLVDDAMKRYGGNMYHMSYNDKTGAIYNLLTKLRAAPLDTAVQTIAANNKIDNVELSQTKFDSLIDKRASEMEPNNYTLTKTRKSVVDELRPLITLIGILSKTKGIAELTEMAAQIDNLIGTTMTSARISQGHSENNKDKNKEEPTGEEPTDETPTDETPANDDTNDENTTNDKTTDCEQTDIV